MRFSIIIPAYNVEKFIKNTIDSVLNQTYDNFELIIVNDCSSDSTANIIEKYDDIIFINHDINGGVAKARNSGIGNAKGEYIIFLDSDDVLKDNTVLDRLDKLISNNSPDIVYLGFEFLNSKEVILPTFEKRSNPEYNILEDRYINIWSKCWNREFLNKNNIRFVESLRYHEDVPFSMAGVCLAENFMIAPFVTHLYTDEREGSLTDNFSNIKNVKLITDIYGYISELIKLTEKVPVETRKPLFDLIRRALSESLEWISRWEAKLNKEN